MQAHKVPHLATPRKTEHPLAPNDPRSWTLRSAGGTRPALVIWGEPAPPDSVLDRLARAGFGVISHSPGLTAADLAALVDGLPRGTLGGTKLAPVGVVCVEPNPAAALIQTLEAKRIPWRQAEDGWDGLVAWFAERLP